MLSAPSKIEHGKVFSSRRILLLLALPFLILSVSGIKYSGYLFKNNFRKETSHELNEKISNFNEKSHSLIRFVSMVEAYSISSLPARNTIISSLNLNDTASSLKALATRLGADMAYILDIKGNAIISSQDDKKDSQSVVGKNFASLLYFKESIGGRSTIYPAVTESDRGIYFASPIRERITGLTDSRIIGVAVIKLNPRYLDDYLSMTFSSPVSFVSPKGRILASNIPEWVYKRPSKSNVENATTDELQDLIEYSFDQPSIRYQERHHEVITISFSHFIDMDGQWKVVMLKPFPIRIQHYWYAGVVLANLMVLSIIFLYILRRETEKNRVWAEKQMVLAKERAEEASRSKSDFLANMSHEIRTPMNAIIGMSELIMREELSPQVTENIGTIKQAGNNLLGIINDILDFSKIESGKLELQLYDYELASMFNDVCNLVRTRIGEKLFFSVYVDSNLPNKLYGDELRVRQVILNILNNAVKYTKKGSVALSISGRKVNSTLSLEVAVNDTGIGIKNKDIDQLFDKFTRFDGQKNRSVEGTGLGLSIAKNLCVMMGGDIAVTSVYGEGSTFTIKVPQEIKDNAEIARLKEPDKVVVLVYEQRHQYVESFIKTFSNMGVSYEVVSLQSDFFNELDSGRYTKVILPNYLHGEVKDHLVRIQPTPEVFLLLEYSEQLANPNFRSLTMPFSCISIANAFNHEASSRSELEKNKFEYFTAPLAKILVVDDILTNLKVMEGLLTPYKMHVDICLSGERAIEMVQESDYDIVFMDQMMPGIDGIEATKRIRALGGEYESLAILAQTANAVRGVREMLIENGFSDFISKPVELHKLHTILALWIPEEKQEKSEAFDTETEEFVFQIDNVDVAKGVSNLGGKVESYLKALKVYQKDGEEKLRQIPQTLKDGDIRLYITCVHALKSASAYIGATKLSEKARALEESGHSKNMGYIEEHTGVFLEELDGVVQAVSKVISEVDANRTTVEEGGDLSDTYEMIGKLRDALESFDINAIDELTKQLEKSKASSLVEQLSKSLLISDFDVAISIIEKFLADNPKPDNG
ncbi:MAG: ATP-binding protein [Holophagaceae bacterium]|nr:ATP-binding protein [Holophagaceae bacterium]